MATPVVPPAGLAPAGTWTPPPQETLAVVPPVLLADSIDPVTGELTSLTTSLHPVDAAISEAFRVLQGSGAAVQATGHRFDKIRKKTERTPRELEDECRRIMQPFVRRGDAQVQGVTVEADALRYGFDGALATVHYVNLHTGRRQSRAVYR